MASTTKHALLPPPPPPPLRPPSPPAIAAAPSGSAAAGNAEVDALMELKAALDPSGRSLPSWARGGDPCGRGDYFEGVSCDARGRVATVSLQGKGLAGAISPAVAMLPGLTGLYLHYNALSGAIPRQLGDLPLLAELYLGVNNLSGAIPVELGRLSSLQVLQLGYNQLSGSIPTQLGQLKKLTVLALQSNQLAGAIPASLGDLPELARLDLSSNHLFGSIPSKLAAIPKLVALDLRNNTLSGSVPSGLKKLNEGFHYDNNSELCGARFDSLKPCANGDGDDNEDGGKMPRKPESTSVNVKPLQPPQTMNVNRDCDNGGCSTSSSSSSSTATTLSSGAILAGTIVIVGGVAACGLSVFSWRRRQKQKVGSTVESLEGRGSMDKQKEACQRSNASSSLINVERGVLQRLGHLVGGVPARRPAVAGVVAERAVQPGGGGVRDAVLLRREPARQERLRGDVQGHHARRHGGRRQEHQQEQLQGGGGRLPPGAPRDHFAPARQPRRPPRVLPLPRQRRVLPRLRVHGQRLPLPLPRRQGRRSRRRRRARLAHARLHHQRRRQRNRVSAQQQGEQGSSGAPEHQRGQDLDGPPLHPSPLRRRRAQAGRRRRGVLDAQGQRRHGLPGAGVHDDGAVHRPERRLRLRGGGVPGADGEEGGVVAAPPPRRRRVLRQAGRPRGPAPRRAVLQARGRQARRRRAALHQRVAGAAPGHGRRAAAARRHTVVTSDSAGPPPSCHCRSSSILYCMPS
uniref:Leucine-rich repeat-containing N-terminal plant-type domain-containing protein n=1 Tax=Oryza brachyantha TaxID=4533 RepID=J3MPW1_ORYBR